MNREDILKRNRLDNRDGDERDRALRVNGSNFGLTVTLVLVLIWGQIQYFAWSQPCGNLYAFAFLGAGVCSAYQYTQCRRGAALAGAVIFFACAAFQMAAYLFDIGVISL